MKNTIIRVFSMLAAAGALASSTASLQAKPGTDRQPLVQIAILLDTSGSMEGLIEQAKGQLWRIVNQFISARQAGRAPDVQVALFEYGKSSLPAAEGFVRMIQPLSNDLDRISEELFKLRTDGGDEYCGWVIREAVRQLAWSKSPDVYRAIFIAGNEPFTQGPVNYAESCKAAIAQGIIVNTIHCGPSGAGINTKWQDGALLADGKYMTIDQNQAVVHFEAPQDGEIVRLSMELNSTYIAYGRRGEESRVRQSAQDANAFSLAPQGAAVGRALAKASANYRNSSWDLVDAVKEKGVQIEGLKRDELPEELRPLNIPQRKDFLEKKAQERADLQEKINQLHEARNKFLAEKRESATTTNTFDAAITSAIREQAAKQSFSFSR